MSQFKGPLGIGILTLLFGIFPLVGVTAWSWKKNVAKPETGTKPESPPQQISDQPSLNYKWPRQAMNDTSGYLTVSNNLKPWNAHASLAEIGRAWERIGYKSIEWIDSALADASRTDSSKFQMLQIKALALQLRR